MHDLAFKYAKKTRRRRGRQEGGGKAGEGGSQRSGKERHAPRGKCMDANKKANMRLDAARDLIPTKASMQAQI